MLSNWKLLSDKLEDWPDYQIICISQSHQQPQPTCQDQTTPHHIALFQTARSTTIICNSWSWERVQMTNLYRHTRTNFDHWKLPFKNSGVKVKKIEVWIFSTLSRSPEIGREKVYILLPDFFWWKLNVTNKVMEEYLIFNLISQSQYIMTRSDICFSPASKLHTISTWGKLRTRIWDFLL